MGGPNIDLKKLYLSSKDSHKWPVSFGSLHVGAVDSEFESKVSVEDFCEACLP